MKDGRTHLAYKAERVVDLKTDLVLAAVIYEANRGTPRASPSPPKKDDLQRAAWAARGKSSTTHFARSLFAIPYPRTPSRRQIIFHLLPWLSLTVLTILLNQNL